jgi:hypothetical protein
MKFLYDKILSPAPVAQWTERRPPEPESTVRVCAGARNRTYPELHTLVEEQFISMLRFEQRGKLEELLPNRK